jgi:hypothetical protein
MGKISFYLPASGVTIKPVTRDRITVELEDVELSDLIEAVEDNKAILDEIGSEKIAEWMSDNVEIENVLDNTYAADVIVWLEKNGYEVRESGA